MTSTIMTRLWLSAVMSMRSMASSRWPRQYRTDGLVRPRTSLSIVFRMATIHTPASSDLAGGVQRSVATEMQWALDALGLQRRQDRVQTAVEKTCGW